MAQTKKTVKTMAWKWSWRGLALAASLTLNVAFVTVVLTFTLTDAVDAMFMREGFARYCDVRNDDKFANVSDKDKALRAYACATGDAKQYFDKGFFEYLDSKGVQHN